MASRPRQGGRGGRRDECWPPRKRVTAAGGRGFVPVELAFRGGRLVHHRGVVQHRGPGRRCWPPDLPVGRVGRGRGRLPDVRLEGRRGGDRGLEDRRQRAGLAGDEQGFPQIPELGRFLDRERFPEVGPLGPFGGSFGTEVEQRSGSRLRLGRHQACQGFLGNPDRRFEGLDERRGRSRPLAGHVGHAAVQHVGREPAVEPGFGERGDARFVGLPPAAARALASPRRSWRGRRRRRGVPSLPRLPVRARVYGRRRCGRAPNRSTIRATPIARHVNPAVGVDEDVPGMECPMPPSPGRPQIQSGRHLPQQSRGLAGRAAACVGAGGLRGCRPPRTPVLTHAVPALQPDASGITRFGWAGSVSISVSSAPASARRLFRGPVQTKAA